MRENLMRIMADGCRRRMVPMPCYSAHSSTVSDAWQVIAKGAPADRNTVLQRPISAANFRYTDVDPSCTERNLPRLLHNLEKVLFNPGVHFLKDPRTGIYNFPRYLESITAPKHVDFNTFSPFVTPSKDKNLEDLCSKTNCDVISSTSAVSGALGAIHQMIFGRQIKDMSRFSQPFCTKDETKFTSLLEAPRSIILRKLPSGIYSIEQDKSLAIETILQKLGVSMEHMLTEPQELFIKRLKSFGHDIPPKGLPLPPSSFYFGKTNRLLLRAQLDCEHPALPRTIFDIKTRATLPIRLDVLNYTNHVDYSLSKTHGLLNSFEREYYDMARAAFLRYIFQLYIGKMDGIFLAYHNTQTIFGFEYVSREEIETVLFGGTDEGKRAFAFDMQVLESIIDIALSVFPGSNRIRLFFVFDRHNSEFFVENIPETEPDSLSCAHVLNPQSSVYVPRDIRGFDVSVSPNYPKGAFLHDMPKGMNLSISKFATPDSVVAREYFLHQWRAEKIFTSKRNKSFSYNTLATIY